MSVKITNAEELGRAIAEAYQSGDQVAQVTAWQGFCRALSPLQHRRGALWK